MKKLISSVMMAICAIMLLHAEQIVVDCGNSVTITATPVTGYHFVRWNDNGTDNPRTLTPTADITYTAYFAINRYTIQFLNYDGTVLQTEELNHGTAVSYKGVTPTKPATAQYTYTFSGWTPNIEYTAVADASYTALFDETVNKYLITFKNWDGSVLEAKEWEYGALPSYAGTPTRPADAEYTYTFTGWNTAISTVTGEAVYTAQYNGTTNSYTLTTSGEHGTTTGDGTYLYGKVVTITAVADECYEFVQWNDGNTNALREVTVNGNVTYTATFRKIQYTVTVESDDEAQGTVSVVAVP